MAGCISSKKKTSGKVSWRERKIAEVLESLKANLSLHNLRFERLLTLMRCDRRGVPFLVQRVHDARSHAVPLALLDVWMPETNGLQVQARLRDVSPDTKVIVMTGREPPAPLCWKARYNDEAVIREKLTIESFAARMPRSASSGMLG